MHRCTLVALGVLQVLLSTEGFINCKTACKQCQIGNDSLDLMEVYCSMCKECRDIKRTATKAAVEDNIMRTSTDSTDTTSEPPTTSDSLTTNTTNSSLNRDASVSTPTTVALSSPPASMPDYAQFTLTEEVTNGEKTTPDDLNLDSDQDDDWLKDCPPPPNCSDEQDRGPYDGRGKCPPVPTCKPKTTMMQQCAPCMPMCYLPCYPNDKPQNSEEPSSEERKELTTNRPANVPVARAFNRPYTYSRRQLNVPLQQNIRSYHYQNSNNYNNNNQRMGNAPDYFYMYLGVPKVPNNVRGPTNGMSYLRL